MHKFVITNVSTWPSSGFRLFSVAQVEFELWSEYELERPTAKNAKRCWLRFCLKRSPHWLKHENLL